MTKFSSTLKLSQWLVLLLAFFAFFMAAWISRTVFERLPHLEDEVAYIYQARIFARGQLVVDTPQPRQAYWQPFVIDYANAGHRFGKYSPGWPLLLSLGVNLGSMWIINAFCGMLTVALVYRLGREIYNADVGLVAAALTAFSPMALLLNGTLMGHTSALCCFTLFMYAYWRTEKTSRAGKNHSALHWHALAGVALGLLVINRPLSAVGVTLPFILWSGGRALRAGGEWYQSRANLLAKPSPYPLDHEEVTYPPSPTPADLSNSHSPNGEETLSGVISPLLLIASLTLFIGLAVPIFNHAATGDATRNLYTLVWPYDQVGFGECCGRHGHTIVKGVRQTRFDLSLMAADLFGWQVEQNTISINATHNLTVLQPALITPELEDHLRLDGDYWPPWGLSFFILPFGLWLGFKKGWLRIWLIVGLLWLIIPLAADMEFLKGYSVNNQPTNTGPLWRWLAFSAFWLLLPPIILLFGKFFPATRKNFQRGHKREDWVSSTWTWLLLGVIVGLIGVHLGYWIGAQRYSTRYYFEALSALAMIGALPIARLARQTRRWIIYPLLAALLFWSLFAYSIPRIQALYRFNNISPEIIEGVEARREGNAPVLVIITGGAENSVKWRSYGALMAVTSPYLDSEIVAARDYAPGSGVREQIISRFPNRQIIEMAANEGQAWFVDGE